MFEIIEDPPRDFHSLMNEARDNLNALARIGGPDFSHFKLAEKLRDVTPRFDWQEGDVEKFIYIGECRFHVPAYKLRGKKENTRDKLNLDDMLAINSYASGELQPLLQKIKASGEKLEVPTELRIHDYGNELMFSFQTAGATKFAYDRGFNFLAMRSLQQLIDYFEREKKGELQPKLMLDLTEEEARFVIDHPGLIDELKEMAHKAISERLARPEPPPSAPGDDIAPK